MRTLRLFEANWTEVNGVFSLDTGQVVPISPTSNLTVVVDHENESWLDARLVVEWSAANLEVHLQIRIDVVGNEWRFVEPEAAALHRFHVGKTPLTKSDKFCLQIGPAHVATSSVQVALQNSEIVFVLPTVSSQGVVFADEFKQPLTIACHSFSCKPSLVGGCLKIMAGSISAKLANVYQTRFTGLRSVKSTFLESRKFEVDLDSEYLNSKVQFQTSPGSDSFLLNCELNSRSSCLGEPINAENIPNSLLPSIEARGFLLECTLARPIGESQTTLTKLQLVPEATEGTLLLHGASNELDETITVNVKAVDLGVRLGSPRCNDNLNIPCVALSRAVLNQGTLSKQIHGLTPGTWGKLGNGGAVVISAESLTDRDFAASLLNRFVESVPASIQIDQDLHMYESLPSVVRNVNDEDDIQVECEISLKDLTSDITQSDAEPIRLKGGVLEIPCIDIDRLRKSNWAIRADKLFSWPIADSESALGIEKLDDGILTDDFRRAFQNNGIGLGNELIITPRTAQSSWSLTDKTTNRDFLIEKRMGAIDAHYCCENPVRLLLEKVNERQRSELGPKAVSKKKLHSSRVAIDTGSQVSRTMAEIVPREPLSPMKKEGQTRASIRVAKAQPEPPLVRQVLEDHTAELDFNNLQFPMPVPRDGFPDNPVPSLLALGKNANFNNFFPNQFESVAPWFKIPFDATVDGDGFNYVIGLSQTLAVIKLQSGVGLEEVVSNLPQDQRGPAWYLNRLVHGGRDQFGSLQPAHQMDGEVLQPGWTGVVLFEPGFLIDVPGLRQLLNKYVGRPLRYLAFSANVNGNPEYSNVYGTYRYVDEGAGEFDDELDKNSDVYWDLGSVDIRFRDREIVHFEISASLKIRKFWQNETNSQTGESQQFKITGRYQSASAEGNTTNAPRIVFEATTNDPIEFDIDLAILDKVSFKGVTVFLEGINSNGDSQASSRFELQGELWLQQWSGGSSLIEVDSSKPVKFSHLGLPLPVGDYRMNWEWPSLEFPLKQKKPFSLGPLSFSFRRIGVGRKDLFDGMLKIAGNEPRGKFPWIGLDVELFKYPQLSENSGKSIGFELIAAIDDDGSTGGVWIAGLDFENLDIDLFRFLRITAKKVSIFNENNVRGLAIQQMTLEILGKKIIGRTSDNPPPDDDDPSGLSAIIFEDTQTKERGFVAFLMEGEGIWIHPVVKIDWVLIANNARLGKIAPLLLTLSGTGDKNIHKEIEDECKKGQLGGNATSGKWGFGIGFTILGEDDSLRAKMLFMDGSVYGLMIESKLLEDLIGFPGFAIAYIKGDTPDGDHFWLELKLPWFSAQAFNFLGGVVAFEIYMNGGFMFDFGFPWLKDGIRQWDRGLGFNVGIYVGHAGVYMRYVTGKTNTGNQEITVAGGIGLAAGYGKSFEFAGGKLKVYVGIEIYGILEGVITIQLGSSKELLERSNNSDSRTLSNTNRTLSNSKGISLQAARLTGIVGIVVRGYGEIDVWVLYAKIEVLAFAESESTLSWANGERAKLTYVFRIGQRFSASCRIGKGWFSWTFRFGYTATMEIDGTIEL